MPRFRIAAQPLRPSRAAGRWSRPRRRLWLGPLGLALGALLAACDDNGPTGSGRPNPPQDLASFTGDAEVILVWSPPSGGANAYNVYAFIPERDDFEVIGVTTSTAFLDNDVQNGVTYRYRVTALDENNDESDFSDETFDTPRPDDFNILLASVQTDPTQAGFDLTSGRVVDAASPDATFRFDESGGVFQIVPINGAQQQDVGFRDALGIGCTNMCVNFAPESGYLSDPLRAFVGNAYVFRIPRGGDDFFAVIRVAHLAPGVLVFDWAFQTAAGNRELLVEPFD